jgi:ribosomal protein S11
VSSASVDKSTEESVIASGATAFLAKPSPDHVVIRVVARAIGVELVEESGTSRISAERAAVTATSPAALQALPHDLRERLSDAARKAQSARLAELAVEVEGHDRGAAALVRELTGQFRYGSLVDALKEPA